jgi:predicted RND superfamily exporter protein
MKRLSRFLAEHRWFAWLLFLVLSIPPGLGLFGYSLLDSPDAEWATTVDRKALDEAQSNFTSQLAGLPSFLVVESDDFFQPERVHALWTAVEKIEQLEEVYGVLWMGSVPHVTLFGQNPLLPGLDADAEEIAAAKELVSTHPLIEGQLLSEDGRTLLMGIFADDRDTMQNVVETAREQLEPLGIKVRLTGPAALKRAHDRTLDAEHDRVLYTAMALIIGLALIIFRGLPAILVTCSGPLVGVAWTLGWLAFVGEEPNQLTKILVPVMAMIIGFTDGVHIVVHVRQERVAGKSQRDAAATAMQQVGLACLLTSVTTGIGFGSLLIADATIIQSFGRSSAIAVFVTFVAVVLVVPLLSGSWLGKNIHKGYERDLIGTNIQKLGGSIDWVVRHSRLVAFVGVGVTAALAMGASTLQPDNRLAHSIPHNCDEWQAMVHCDETFGGIHFLRVLISWEEGTPREDIWNVILETERELNAEKLLGRSLSVRHWLSVLPGAEGPEKLALSSLLPEEFRHEFWNSDERQAQVVSRMQDLGMAVYRPILDQLEARFRKIEQQHPGIKLRITGEAIVKNQIVQRVVRELFHSLALAAVIIFLVITVTFRSLRLGLLSIIPNVFPLAATASLRAVFFGTSLDISSACAFAICLGIAVDDTIHFLIRFIHEREAGHEPPEAIHRTFVTVGSALVMTTAVMVSGFGSVMTSSLPTHFLFATMAFTTIAAALVGDLILLPALLVQFPGRSAPEETTE